MDAHLRFLDHIDVAELELSRRFYAAALSPWHEREVQAGEAYGNPNRG